MFPKVEPKFIPTPIWNVRLNSTCNNSKIIYSNYRWAGDKNSDMVDAVFGGLLVIALKIQHCRSAVSEYTMVIIPLLLIGVCYHCVCYVCSLDQNILL